MNHGLLHHTFACILGVSVLSIGIRSAAIAQASPDFAGGAARHTFEVSPLIGRSDIQGVDLRRHTFYGGTFGYYLNPRFTLLGEYTFLPMGTSIVNGPGVTTTGKENFQIAGAALRYNFKPIHGVVPYVQLGGGYIHNLDKYTYTNGLAPSDYSASGYNVDAAGGLNIHLARNWGIRPEFRWDRQNLYPGVSQVSHENYFGSVGVFYQFGWRGKK